MSNRKNNLKFTSPTNDAYESDVDKSDGRKMSSEMIPEENLNENEENFRENSDDVNDPPPLRSHTKNNFAIENVAKTHLSGIPEEIGRNKKKHNDNPLEDIDQENKNKKDTNMGFHNMSLSNFKMLQGNVHEDGLNDGGGLKRDASHASIIHMKQIQSDPIVHTGRNFRRISTFVITPKEHNGQERLSIKVLDQHNVPELFIELDSLYLNLVTQNYYWIEKYRWIKFEEEYNRELQHFNSPHLPPLTIKSIKQFRKTLSKGEMILDCNDEELIILLNNVAETIAKSETFTKIEMIDIRNSLIYKHTHARDHLSTSESEVSMHRYDNENQRYYHQQEHIRKRSNTSFNMLEAIQRKFSHVKLEEKLESGTESLSIQVGALESLESTFSLLVRLNNPIKAEGITEVDCPLRFLFIIFGPKSKEEELIEIGRVFAVMMSNIEFREVGYSANTKEDILTATKIFVTHSVLIPLNKQMSFDTTAAMLPHLKYYLNCFLSEQNQKTFDEMKKELAIKNKDITLTQVQNENQKKVSVNSLALSPIQLSEFQNQGEKDNENITKGTDKKMNKTRTFCCQLVPPFRNFIVDIKGLKSRYASDFKDAFKKSNAPIVFLGIIFIYFVVMAPAITFGALLNAVNPKMTISMMLLASGVYQFILSFFGGNPFEIAGITGPVFSIDKVLGSISLTLKISHDAMRFWIGIYVAILGIVTIAFNGTVILKHVRRSVEEIYNLLVSVIYVLSAFFTMFGALPYSITPLALNNTNADVIVSERLKFGIGGSNLFLAFFIANFCLFLVTLKKGTFYRRKIRMLLGSLNVPLGILLIVIMNQIFFRASSLPTLNVPPSDKVNFTQWFNIPTTSNIIGLSVEGHGYCILIAICLYSIITCEVSCNAILVTRSERKLLKPALYSLNFFIILVIFPILSGILGWPFISGGTVRSHMHCMAMTTWSLRLPGVPPKVTGAVEQRVSGSLVGIFVLLSVFIGTILRFIPLAAMYGMFLYIGLMGAVDLVFIRRTINILRRRKYWKDHNFLKDIPQWHIAVFVSIQLVFMGILVLLNCISQYTIYIWTPLLFPWTIVAFALLRGYILPRWPRLNTHLSKMDKKHPVKLFYELKTVENVVLTVNQNGVDIKVMETVADNTAYENSDNESNAEDIKIKN